jgi:hypothetical protein
MAHQAFGEITVTKTISADRDGLMAVHAPLEVQGRHAAGHLDFPIVAHRAIAQFVTVGKTPAELRNRRFPERIPFVDPALDHGNIVGVIFDRKLDECGRKPAAPFAIDELGIQQEASQRVLVSSRGLAERANET